MTTLSAEVMRRCDALAAFSEDEGRLTRTFLCPAMRDVHEAVSGWMRGAGMTARVDAVGNLIGRYPAQEEAAPVLLFGSHLDTVRDAGRYDGALGVLLAVAAVEALGGRRLPFAVEVIGFSEEEGVRFGTPYLGSLGVVGKLTPALLGLTDQGDVTVAEAIRRFGLGPPDLTRAGYAREELLGYVEAHIEQGPVLETAGLPVGIVTAIAGQTRVRVTFAGRAGHAGTTPMAGRRDALAGAADFVLAVEARASARANLVATVGSLAVAPNAPNVIPGSVELSLDVRHPADAVRETAVADIRATAQAIASRRGLDIGWRTVAQQNAVLMDGPLSRLLAASVESAGCVVSHVVSGAGHDAAVMAGLTPSAMLFLRSPGGVSHHPEETVRPEDVAVALAVLSDLLRRVQRPGVGEEESWRL